MCFDLQADIIMTVGAGPMAAGRKVEWENDDGSIEMINISNSISQLIKFTFTRMNLPIN